MPQSYSTDPLHVAVSKSKGITIDWSDSHTSRYTCALLRDACPCASCTGAHGTEPQKSSYSSPSAADPFPLFKPALKMDSIEEVGAYAVRIHWNDGHDAGIYSFAYLRTICPCPECELARQQGRLTVSA
ncbi:MAG TPA: gamma-butyrobetaine hydroxylase-like domain-containing protein [Bryobacteraceae bacterium]|nr:gamma-butyrobetaine hydroxylase-like domain-containing protein [Bryobacteraceae bacterium]